MMKVCPKCKKHIRQMFAHCSPEEPVSRRGYICYNCEMGYVEIVDNASHNVIRVEETDLHVSNERQTSLLEW